MSNRLNPIAPTLLASAVKCVTVLANVPPSLDTLHLNHDLILECAGGGCAQCDHDFGIYLRSPQVSEAGG